MTARLTAWILSFCIALPMCWCCEGAPEQAEVTGCCSMARAQACSQEGQVPAEHCPCASHQDNRDTTDVVVTVPVPALKFLPALQWQTTGAWPPARLFSCSKDAARHEPGPSEGATPPLYSRHCARLL